MALLTIRADGSFEAIAMQDTYASKIKAYKTLIKSTQTGIKERKKKVEPLKRIAALKLRLQHVPPSQKESIRSKISAERQKHALSTKDTVLGMQRQITKLEGQIAKHEDRIARLTQQEADAKERAKVRKAKEALAPKQPKVNIGGPGIGGAGAKIPRTPKDPAAKFAQQAKTASGKLKHTVKVTLDKHEAQALKPAPKPAVKPTASTVKPTKVLTHKDDKNATAIKNTLTKIYALKKELANATPTKKPHMQADLAKLRGALRELRKGATAEGKPKLPAEVNGRRVKQVKPVKPVAVPTPKTKSMGTTPAARAKLERMLEKAKAEAKDLRKRVTAAKGQGPLYGKLSIQLQSLNAKIVRLEGKIKQK
jgi:hypothetical protein